jgi:hypothetical protein
MHEIRLECSACGAHLTVPMSDQYQLPDGTVVDASALELPNGCETTCRGCPARGVVAINSA